MKPKGSKTKAKIQVVENNQIRSRLDYLATEEPLEIRLLPQGKTLAITMRTPGNDFELATGFLYSEGIVSQRQDIEQISYCVEGDRQQLYNIVNVTIKPELKLDLPILERHFFTNSACGVCGKVSIEHLKNRAVVINNSTQVLADLIYGLPDKLRLAQGIFNTTGGLHAAALFNLEGKLIKVREDVGRHNALDKLIGSIFLANELPLNNYLILVSGRSSFEILQKCIMASVPIVCAVSAPSSLAVSLAEEFGVTLIGFLRDRKFNVYSGKKRILASL
jgi:FdhD protein